MTKRGKRKGERGLYQRGDTWGIIYYFNGKHSRKDIVTKGDARKELTAIRAKIGGCAFVPPREDSFDGLVDEDDSAQNWHSHKTSTSVTGQEKGLRAEYPQPLVFAGAEEGS